MSWPLKLRAISFGIGIGVVMGEVALVTIPIGLALWMMGFAGIVPIAEAGAAIALAIALVIIVPVHIRPSRMAPALSRGELQ
jgi:hypothetical protein